MKTKLMELKKSPDRWKERMRRSVLTDDRNPKSAGLRVWTLRIDFDRVFRNSENIT